MLDIHDEIVPVDEGGYPAIPTTRHHDLVQPRHRVILKRINEGVPMKQAMAEVGYSGSSLNSPTFTLGKTRSWQALMDEFIPEATLAWRHQELLNLRDQQKIKNLNGDVVELRDVPDAGAVTKALEMAYKLRGSFKESAAPPKSQTIYNLFYKPEIREQVRMFEDSLKQSMIHDASTYDAEDEDGASPPPAGDDGDVAPPPAESIDPTTAG